MIRSCQNFNKPKWVASNDWTFFHVFKIFLMFLFWRDFVWPTTPILYNMAFTDKRWHFQLKRSCPGSNRVFPLELSCYILLGVFLFFRMGFEKLQVCNVVGWANCSGGIVTFEMWAWFGFMLLLFLFVCIDFFDNLWLRPLREIPGPGTQRILRLLLISPDQVTRGERFIS